MPAMMTARVLSAALLTAALVFPQAAERPASGSQRSTPAQFGLIFQSLRPKGYQKESFASRKALLLAMPRATGRPSPRIANGWCPRRLGRSREARRPLSKQRSGRGGRPERKDGYSLRLRRVEEHRRISQERRWHNFVHHHRPLGELKPAVLTNVRLRTTGRDAPRRCQARAGCAPVGTVARERRPGPEQDGRPSPRGRHSPGPTRTSHRTRGRPDRQQSAPESRPPGRW